MSIHGYSQESAVEFLFSNEPRQLPLSSALRAYAEDEWEAVSEYVQSVIGTDWIRVVERWTLNNPCTNWAEACERRLVTNQLLKRIEREGVTKALSCWLDTSPPTLVSIPQEEPISDGKFALLIGHPAINSELKWNTHPEAAGHDIECESLDSVRNHASAQHVALAICIIRKASVAVHAHVTNCISRIALVKATPTLPNGQCISLTIRAAPGLVVLSEPPTLLLAESLIHEAAHSRLYAIETISPIVDDTAKLVSTPFRKDLRPLVGLFHQSYVLHWLLSYYEKLEAVDDPRVRHNCAKIRKRHSEIATALNAALSTLKAEMCELTKLGTSVAEQLFSLHQVA